MSGLSIVSRKDTISRPLKNVHFWICVWGLRNYWGATLISPVLASLTLTLDHYDTINVLVSVVGSKATARLLKFLISFSCNILSCTNVETLFCCSTENDCTGQYVELLLTELLSHVEILHLLIITFFLAKQNVILLKIHIAFSIPPTKMKTCFLLFFFTHTKYIYLKRKKNSFLTMVPIKNKNKCFCRKKVIKQFYVSRSSKSEKVQGSEALAMKVISLESLQSVF